MTANSNGALRSALRQAQVIPVKNFEDRSHTGRAWLRAIRLHQWAKNVLVFLPLLLGHAWNVGTLVGAVIAFLGMGLCASSTYIVNDLLDLETDRRHPRKRRRPFAAGDLSAIAGTVVAILMFCSSMILAFLLPRIVLAVGGVEAGFKLLGWLAIYAVSTLAYSLYLKKQMLVDVFMLSGLYTLRILAGSAATGVAVSPWLAAFSIFFFLSLAFLKRFSELKALQASDAVVRNGRGYQLSDMEQLRVFGTGAGCAAAVVLTLYINDPAAKQMYHHPARIWLVTPVLLLWLFRMWILASRGEMNEDPVDYAITDKRSLLLGALVAAIVFLAL